MPEGFPEFRAAAQVRTPHELICHMTSVLGYARTFFIGGIYPVNAQSTWEKDIQKFHAMLEEMGEYLESETPLIGITEEHLLQGPFSDAMTHAGQIAMLRRLAGSPVPPENFIKANVNSDNLTANQPDPVSPDEVWPEGPKK